MGTRNVVAAGAIAAGALFLAQRTLRRRKPIEFRDRVVLITGGTRGLGLKLAERFVAEGARVAVCARDEEELEQVRTRLGAPPGQLLAIECDVADRKQVSEMISEVREHLGPVDVLINVAGVIQVGPLEAMQLEDFEQAMDIMYWGTVYTTLEVLPEMRSRRNGSIANITSIGGKVAVPHLTPYVAAKFAAVGFSEAITAEEAENGIRVTTIAPGLMRTGSFLQAWFKGDQELEYAWFAPSSSLSLLTISADDAARSIIEAIRHGKREVVLSWQAKILAFAHGVSPSATVAALSVVNRLFADSADQSRKKGQEARNDLDSQAVDRLTKRGLEAADELQ